MTITIKLNVSKKVLGVCRGFVLYVAKENFCAIINPLEVCKVKITFLGTGAADWPKKKPMYLREYRRASSALIDGVLLIDPGPQVFDSMKEFKINPRQIGYIINTHRHGDHYCEETVRKAESCGARFCSFSHGETKAIGKYTVSAYKANHGTCEDTVHFIISDGKSTLFYGLDGAWLLYDEIEAIKNHKPDFAVFDATVGKTCKDCRIFEHNNLQMVIEQKKALEPYIGKFCISHISRKLQPDHSAICKETEKYGITVACDGLTVEF